MLFRIVPGVSWKTLNSNLEQGNTNKGPNLKQGNLEEVKIKRNER